MPKPFRVPAAGIWVVPIAVLSALAMAGEPNPSDIVVVLADDLGIGDIHCYDSQRSKIPTPNLDRLARQGMMFTDALRRPLLCCPTVSASQPGKTNPEIAP